MSKEAIKPVGAEMVQDAVQGDPAMVLTVALYGERPPQRSPPSTKATLRLGPDTTTPSGARATQPANSRRLLRTERYASPFGEKIRTASAERAKGLARPKRPHKS
jgi:hypothetical protein